MHLSAELSDVDEAVDRTCQGRRWTLAPQGGQATRLATVVEKAQHLFEEEWSDIEKPLLRGLVAFVRAQLDAFPGNLFWDFEYLIAAVHADLAKTPPSTRATRVSQYFAKLTDLHARYGRHSLIRFRYVHDFTYGFDWSKWVLRDSTWRQGMSSFAVEFLDHLQRRAGELHEEIHKANPQGFTRSNYRNPFGFSREPADEALLLRELSRRNLIPVRAWLMTLPQSVKIDYSAERSKCAHELGLD